MWWINKSLWLPSPWAWPMGLRSCTLDTMRHDSYKFLTALLIQVPHCIVDCYYSLKIMEWSIILIVMKFLPRGDYKVNFHWECRDPGILLWESEAAQAKQIANFLIGINMKMESNQLYLWCLLYFLPCFYQHFWPNIYPKVTSLSVFVLYESFRIFKDW